MFRYLTSYRFYSLAKIGFGLAYLWFIWDFFWIHVAYWNGLSFLLSGAYESGPSNNSLPDQLDSLLAGKVFVWLFFIASPLIVTLYLWGQHRWLQLAVGCWINCSLIAMISLVGAFCSTADVWLSYVFLAYSLTALTCPSGEWSTREPGLSLSKWRENPVLASTYAWLVVLVQFTVYFFAGVNKLIDGWGPWTTGTALQNLAVDSSMHDYARGIHVPYLISLILCYVTLFQRLVVPFGFFFMRYRGWAVLILAAMHVGYDILMQVAIFPLIGVASLLMIVPPRSLALPLFSRPSLHQPRSVRRLLQADHLHTLYPTITLGIFSLWLLLESTRLTFSESFFWENRLVLVPAWRMFADGGINSGKKWQLILRTPYGEVNETSSSLQLLPHLWRDRFYIDQILHYVIDEDPDPAINRHAPMVNSLLQTTEMQYEKQQLQLRQNPAVWGARFAILLPGDGSQ
jgi:Vitamin K-dependent gamma-carboxylase